MIMVSNLTINANKINTHGHCINQIKTSSLHLQVGVRDHFGVEVRFNRLQAAFGSKPAVLATPKRYLAPTHNTCTKKTVTNISQTNSEKNE